MIFNKFKSINFNLVIFFIVIAIIPFVTFLYIYPEPIYSEYTWYSDHQDGFDFNLHSKAIIYSILSIFILIKDLEYFFRSSIDEKRRAFKVFCPMALYLFFVILSSVLSLDKSNTLHGAYDQTEPILVLLGYSLTAFYVYAHLKSEKDIKVFQFVIVISSLLMATIGLLQAIGYNIYEKPWMKYLMMTKEWRENTGNIYGRSGVYGALGNTNYVGSYVILMVPIVFMTALTKKNKIFRVVAAVGVIALTLFLVLSKSLTGVVSLAGVVFFALIFKVDAIRKKWFIFLPAIVACIIVAVTFGYRSSGTFLSKITDNLTIKRRIYDLTEINTKEDCVKLVYKGHEIELRLDPDDDGVYDKVMINGVEYEPERDYETLSNVVTFGDNDKLLYQLSYMDDGAIMVELNFDELDEAKNYVFKYIPETDDYKIKNYAGVYDESIKWDNALPGYEYLASGRGYVWGTTIPRLKDYLFIGAGPDNYPVAMGKDGTDYALKYNAGNYGIVFVRPHNYFLQMGINTGCVSLLACLIFFAMYIIDCWKLYFWKELDSDVKKIGFGCMLSVVGFLGCGIANDSMVSVTPIFWTLLGVGMTINMWLHGEKIQA